MQPSRFVLLESIFARLHRPLNVSRARRCSENAEIDIDARVSVLWPQKKKRKLIFPIFQKNNLAKNLDYFRKQMLF